MTKRRSASVPDAGGKQPSIDKATAERVLKARATSPKSEDKQAMTASLERNRARGERVAAMVANFGDGRVWIGEPHSDARGFLIRLQDAFGTHSDEFAQEQLHYLSNVASNRRNGGAREVQPQALNSMLAAVDGVRPRDEIEGMLAVQMATTHAMAMDCLMRAQRTDTIPQLEANGNLANRLLRTYAVQVEALAKLRRGGTQKVVVQHQHVNVHDGGQAVVGDVYGAGGGGGGHENGQRPHEARAEVIAGALGFAPVAPLWSEEPGREAVPVACGEGAEEVSTARRRTG